MTNSLRDNLIGGLIVLLLVVAMACLLEVVWPRPHSCVTGDYSSVEWPADAKPGTRVQDGTCTWENIGPHDWKEVQ